jgi:hypothetical protein
MLVMLMCFEHGGVVKSPISCVVNIFVLLNIPCVLFRNKKMTTPCVSKFLLSHLQGFYEFIKHGEMNYGKNR